MSIDVHEAVVSCAKMLSDHNGGDTIVLDFRKLSTWTDFFIVTSATSSTHLKGLARRVEDFMGPLEFSPLRRPRLAEDEQWCLLDFGDFVVHIMAAEARAFYELDKLWFEAELTRYPASEPGQEGMKLETGTTA